MDTQSSGAKRAPALDEETFQQILAAAFVVQQHSDKLRLKPGAVPRPRQTVATIIPPHPSDVEAFRLISSAPPQPSASGTSQGPASVCRGCGQSFSEDESFCGVCGTARSLESGDLQSKWASLWFMQQASHLAAEPTDPDMETAAPEKRIASPEPAATAANDGREISARRKASTEPLPPALQEILDRFQAEEELHENEHRHNTKPLAGKVKNGNSAHAELELKPRPNQLLSAYKISSSEILPEEIEASSRDVSALTESSAPLASPPAITSAEPNVWSSAARARSWLESLKKQRPNRVWLASHRANIYLAISALLLLVAFLSWGNSPASRQGSQPQLTVFEQMLVDSGIAEAPPVREYPGNPNVKVWEDVHTALYYCPGADLYGKTPGGKLASQRDAQLDAFEPALRQPCD